MKTLTIPLTDEQLIQLRERAEREQRTLEEVAGDGLREWLSEQVTFERAADYVLEKNAELHERLS